VPARKPAKPKKLRLTFGEECYLWASAVAVVVSVIKVPVQPINDAALFEYFGRAMLHGQRLYVDLYDNKPPSIYLVNLGLQATFGSNYFLHACAEGVLNLASIVLFALMLRRLGVEAWALGTFLFTVFFSLPYPQFDFTQHYAVFFIILGLYLHVRGADLWAGLALAVASTFWIPAALTCIPVLAQRLEKKRTLAFVAGFAGALLAGAAVSVALLGPKLANVFPQMWSGYVERSSSYTLRHLDFTLSHSALIPTVIGLLAFLLVVASKPLGETSRFALLWSACALAGSFIPPNFSEHYYLPSIAPLALAIASFGVTPAAFRRRPVLALVAAVALIFAARQTVVNADVVRADAAYVATLGTWIRDSFGSGAYVYTEEYFPDIQLASDARNIGARWHAGQPIPDVIVAGPRSLPKMVHVRQEVTWDFGGTKFTYRPVCAGRTGSLIAIYAISNSASAFHCATLGPI
jgi:hypothetical protein